MSKTRNNKQWNGVYGRQPVVKMNFGLSAQLIFLILLWKEICLDIFMKGVALHVPAPGLPKPPRQAQSRKRAPQIISRLGDLPDPMATNHEVACSNHAGQANRKTDRKRPSRRRAFFIWGRLFELLAPSWPLWQKI